MNKSNQRIRKFNPGIHQSDEEVIEQFVVRERELHIVLEVLRGNIDSPSCQHVLVVAPRGRGKTMLLARIAAELNMDAELSEWLLPVRFMEESYQIFSLADFWLETLSHLVKESAGHDPVLAQELQKAYDDLADRWRERELADRVLATVLDAADRLGKKLVLMVENLQSIYENVDDDFGWQLRGALQTEPQIMLIATATSRFKGLDDAEQPFCEQFRILDLEPLATEDCCRLWRVVSGDEVSADAIKPIKILTGGNPRLLVIVAGFEQHQSLRELLEELVTLIDEHTEYFRSHLEGLPKVERRVYLALLDLWNPSSPGEIAAKARMDIRIVSTMLIRLIDRGMVRVEGTGRKRWYQVSEILYRYYYHLRRARDEPTFVKKIILFMIELYENRKEKLEELFRNINLEAAKSKSIQEGTRFAFTEQPRVQEIFYNRVPSSIDEASVLATLINMDKANNFAMLIGNESVRQLFKEINVWLDAGAFDMVIETVDQAFTTRIIDRDRDSEPLIALALSAKGFAHETRGDFEAALACYDEATTSFGDSDAIALQERVAWALFRRGIAMQNHHLRDFGELDEYDFEAARECFDEVTEEIVTRFGDSDSLVLQKLVAMALSHKGDTHLQYFGDFDYAISAYDEVIVRFGDSDAPDLQELVASALHDKGDAYCQFEVFEEAIFAYDEMVSRFGDSDAPDLQELVASALHDKGNTHRELDDFEEAIFAYNELIRRFGDSDAIGLQIPVSDALYAKGNTHRELSDFEAAVACYDEVVSRFGDSDAPYLQERVTWALPDKGLTQIKMGHGKEALHTCEEIEKRLGTLTGDERIEFTWRVRYIRALALMVQKKHRYAIDAFRSAYAAFPLDHAVTMREMQRIVPELIAHGASVCDLVEILASDEEKSGEVVPLIVALRLRTGEVVRAPVEVLEVAKDINKDIDAKMAN